MQPEAASTAIVALAIALLLSVYVNALLIHDLFKRTFPKSPRKETPPPSDGIPEAEPADDPEPWEQDPDEWKRR